MTTVLALAAAFFTLVNSNNIFSDFAGPLCQQRHDLSGDVVCQPNGEFAARQCSLTTGICYCATETGNVIEGTQFRKDKNYICRNVQYDVEYKYPHKTPGFDVDDMLAEENELTKKLKDMDKRSAVWEIMSAVKTKHASEKGNWVLETVVAGYNTRLDFEDVSKKIRNVLGDTSGSGRLQIREIYNSVHEGECPVEPSPCVEEANTCYSDSECQDSEICCATLCEHRCVAAYPDPTFPTTESTSEYSSHSEGDTQTQTESSPTTDEWYKTDSTAETEELNTETEALTSHDWSTTDFTEDLTSDQGSSTEYTTQPFTTEELLVTSTTSSTTDKGVTSDWVTQPIEFSPSSEATGSTSSEVSKEPTEDGEVTGDPKSTWTPSYTEISIDTTETVGTTTSSATTDGGSTVQMETKEPTTLYQSTQFKTTFVNSLGSESSSGMTEGSTSEVTTEEMKEFSSTESMGSSSEETRHTTDVTGFSDSPTTEGGPTDPLNFLETTSQSQGSDSITYITQQLTAFTEEKSDSQTVDLTFPDMSDTPATTKPIVTSSQMMSMCEQEAAQAISEGRQGPLCLESGSYNPEQCDQNRNICWCVDEKGLELKGSRRYGSADCDSFRVTTAPMTTTEPMGDCWRAYQRAVKEQAYNRGVMIPTCQSNGLYSKSQCHGTYCWCVDEMNGVMVNGTKKPGPIDCDLFIDGECPEYAREHDSVCINKCDSDESCYGSTKCCQTSCGRDCVYPQLPADLKEGQCPAPQSMNSIFEQCAVECKSDQDCDDTNKCCFNGCGYTCSPPIYDTNIYCKKVDSLYKGTVEDPREQYTEGDVLTVSCDYGYELQGHNEIRCLANGDWEHDLPVCKRISCGVPGSGQFMVVRGSDYFVGGVVTYHCYSGYELSGNSSATCLLSGRWDSEPPSCKRVQCPEMNDLPYGRVYGRTMTYGNRIGFRCDYGYTLVGSEQRLCLSDGTWSGTDPTCVRGYFSRTRRDKFMQQDESEVGGGKCQYGVVDTIDYNGECIEEVLTIDCQCGEPESVEQKVKVLCQRGDNEFIERTVKIGKDCSCCL